MNPGTPPSGPLLVVDDDRLVLLTLSHGLRQAGYAVIEADNGDDAILLARQHQPRLALLDIRMQGLSGFDVAQHLRDYTRIPFLFISAYADARTQAQARELGALACLTKPVNLPALVEWIGQTLAAAPAAAMPGTGLTVENPQPMGRKADEPTTVAAGPLEALDEVSLAVGLLMQRDRQGLDEAMNRLQAQAQAQSLSLLQGARQVLQAHALAVSAPPAADSVRG